MSEQDDTLLDEDLGDDEYDLGNEEEEALLADDDIEKLPERSQKGEEETDDILELGVTDALDDLETEEENLLSKSKGNKADDNVLMKNDDCDSQILQNKDKIKLSEKKSNLKVQKEIFTEIFNSTPVNQTKTDLREKLIEKGVINQKDSTGRSSNIEDDDFKEERIRRNRFQSERADIISKSSNDIPDSLETFSVVENQRSFFKKHLKDDKYDRTEKFKNGRFDLKNSRGRHSGRFETRASGRFPMHGSSALDQQLSYRASTQDNWSFKAEPTVNNVPVPIHRGQLYPPIQSTYHPILKGHPLQHPSFLDNPSSRLPSQFLESTRSQTHCVRPTPVMDYRMDLSNRFPSAVVSNISSHSSGDSRLSSESLGIEHMSRADPPYQCLQVQPSFLPSNQRIFSNHSIQACERLSHCAGNTFPVLPSTSNRSNIDIEQRTMITVNKGSLPNSQTYTQPEILNPNRSQANASGQPMFENRVQYSNSQFETPCQFNSGQYNCLTINQFKNVPPNAQVLPKNIGHSPQTMVGTGVTSVSNIPGVPSRHKILINPHFKGNQTKNDVKTLEASADKYIELINNTSKSLITDSSVKNQKCDDPFSYFSDVWQDSKSQRSQVFNLRKSFSPESDYSRSSGHHYDTKLKEDNELTYGDNLTINHRNIRGNIRNQELSPRIRSNEKNYAISKTSKFHRHDYSSTKTSSSKGENEKSSFFDHEVELSVKRSIEKISPKTADKKEFKKLKLLGKKNIQTLHDKQKKEKEIDPDMEEYKKKMDEQKRLRERILKEKENRRKLAALKKDIKVLDYGNAPENHKQDLIPTKIALNRNLRKKKDTFCEKRIREEEDENSPIKKHIKEEKRSSINLLCSSNKFHKIEYNVNSSNIRDKKTDFMISNVHDALGNLKSDFDYDNIVEFDDTYSNDQDEIFSNYDEYINECDNYDNDNDEDNENDDVEYDDDIGTVCTDDVRKNIEDKLSPEAFRKKPINNCKKLAIQRLHDHRLNSNSNTSNTNQQLDQIKKLLVNSQRLVTISSNPTRQKIIDSKQRCQNHARLVHKTRPQEMKKEVKSNIVKIENLAISTTETQIRQMCQGIGSVQSIQLADGKAIVTFKTQSAAAVFQKKYQRKMLDLSLIKVQFLPQVASFRTSRNQLKQN